MTLDETIAIRTRDGATMPLVERGTALPTQRAETLSTADDRQPSVRCELVTLGATTRSVAWLEVGVAPAPRGVPQVRLRLRIDADGAVQADLDAPHGNANASFSVGVR